MRLRPRLPRSSPDARGWCVLGLLPLGRALLALAVGALVLLGPFGVAAQSADLPVGSTARVVDTGGVGLNLRSAPSRAGVVVARLPEGTVLDVTGPEQAGDGLRWIPVREPEGKTGWVAAQYLAAIPGVVATGGPPSVGAATPTAVPTPRATATPAPAPATPLPTPTPGPPVDVDARLKFPETDHRDQGITVTVTRFGVPVPDARVWLTVEDSDPLLVRELPPTNFEGQTARTFDIRREKGTVILLVTAEAPDGGKGRQTVSFFRR